MNGTQLSKSEKRPYFRYFCSAASSLCICIGNQRLSRWWVKNLPKLQFTSAPSTFPAVATVTRATTAPGAANNWYASTASDCAGSIVAARNALMKTEKYKLFPCEGEKWNDEQVLTWRQRRAFATIHCWQFKGHLAG